MTFDDIPSGATIFLDANIFVYHFSANPLTGPNCQKLFGRIVSQDIQGATSAHILAEATHRLLTIEA